MPVNIEICLILHDKLRFVVIAFRIELNIAKSVYFIKNDTGNNNLRSVPKESCIFYMIFKCKNRLLMFPHNF
jgi:hypothetical protein